MISIIAAVGQNLELGKNNDLIWHLPNDLQFFKEKTLDKTIFMGYNTFISLGRVLPRRKHVVLCFEPMDLPEDVLQFTNIEEAITYLQQQDSVFVIGGASVYKQLILYADNLYLTEIHATSEADVYFPTFDKTKYTRTILGHNEDNGICYDHVLYERNKQ